MKTLKYYFNKFFFNKPDTQFNPTIDYCKPLEEGIARLDSKSIYKFDRNRLFKGHQGRISLMNFNNQQVLDFSNTYFGGYTNHRYVINDNQTHLMSTKHIKMPNKIQKKVEALSNYMHQDIIEHGNIPGIRFKHETFTDNNGIHDSISFETRHMYSHKGEDLEICIVHRTIKPGLHVHGHYDNIQELNALNLRYKIFKQNMESLSIEDLSKKLLENRINLGKLEDSIQMYLDAPDQHTIYHNQFKNLTLELDNRFFE